MKDFSSFDASLWERKIENEYKQREQERLVTFKRLIKVLKDYFKEFNKLKDTILYGSIKEQDKHNTFGNY